MEPIEYVDLLDEKGEKIGTVVPKDEAHEKGLLHTGTHVWIVNSKKEILIQLRAKDKVAYPDCWDISAAGHVSAGETSLQAGQRETEEELGLKISTSSFKLLATLEEHIVINNGTYINNEFQDVFLVQKDLDISELKLIDGEVETVRWIGVEEFKKWVKEKRPDLVPHDEEYQLLFKTIESL